MVQQGNKCRHGWVQAQKTHASCWLRPTKNTSAMLGCAHLDKIHLVAADFPCAVRQLACGRSLQTWSALDCSQCYLIARSWD